MRIEPGAGDGVTPEYWDVHYIVHVPWSVHKKQITSFSKETLKERSLEMLYTSSS